jgi:DNA-binding NtrC family response regulator
VQISKIDNMFEDATLEDMERILIKRALEDNKGNRQAAADKLGISLSTLWRRLKEMGMTMSN